MPCQAPSRKARSIGRPARRAPGRTSSPARFGQVGICRLPRCLPRRPACALCRAVPSRLTCVAGHSSTRTLPRCGKPVSTVRFRRDRRRRRSTCRPGISSDLYPGAGQRGLSADFPAAETAGKEFRGGAMRASSPRCPGAALAAAIAEYERIEEIARPADVLRAAAVRRRFDRRRRSASSTRP